MVVSFIFFFKQKTAYEMRISDWSSDVCSSDLGGVSVEGDRVFATSGLGDVAALNASSGSVIWKKRPGGPLRGSPTLSNGNVYVVSQDNQIFALNAENGDLGWTRSEEHTSELQSLMRISYAVFCLKTQNNQQLS